MSHEDHSTSSEMIVSLAPVQLVCSDGSWNIPFSMHDYDAQTKLCPHDPFPLPAHYRRDIECSRLKSEKKEPRDKKSFLFCSSGIHVDGILHLVTTIVLQQLSLPNIPFSQLRVVVLDPNM